MDFSDFVYDKKKMNIDKELCWNIFHQDINAGKIEVLNVFHFNWVFTNRLIEINKDKGITFEDFEKKVRLALMSEYWSRCEYETVITSWPPHVDGKEIDRLNKERTEYIEKWGKFYCTDVRLSVGEKIDVFSQITMNWEHFINYLWNNRKLIKKLKKVG